MTALQLVCSRCGTKAALPGPWRCVCDGPFDLSGDVLTATEVSRFSKRHIWRHVAGIRVPPDVKEVTLGEGDTPLLPLPTSIVGERVFCKLEFLSPSGSFKDRGTAIMMAVAAWAASERVVCDSSGNAGSSVAAYAAALGLPCDVYVPAGTSSGKLSQIRAYGANVVLIDGDRETVAATARKALDNAFYASHYWNPFFLEGTKTAAYEVWEQLERTLPDHVVIPVGHGTLFLGMLHGFEDLMQRNGLPGLPRLHVAQSEKCAPIAQAYDGTPRVNGRVTETMAEGIRIPRPVRLDAVLDSLKRSGGRAVAVSEDAIEEAHRFLARCGWFVEPTSAVALAGYRQLAQTGAIASGETVVVPLTGHGLKAAHLLG